MAKKKNETEQRDMAKELEAYLLGRPTIKWDCADPREHGKGFRLTVLNVGAVEGERTLTVKIWRLDQFVGQIDVTADAHPCAVWKPKRAVCWLGDLKPMPRNCDQLEELRETIGFVDMVLDRIQTAEVEFEEVGDAA